MIHNKIKYTLCAFLVITIAILIYTFTNNQNDCQLLDSLNPNPLTSQILVVKSPNSFKAQITMCQLQGKKWDDIQSYPGVIGKNGIAPMGEKKEGDLKTPAGLYPLGTAFGTEPMAIKMDYKYITPDDKFIDDVTSAQYNTWVSGPTTAKSFESMLITPYKMGAVIHYNMNPTIPGAGSAIFLHLWQSAETGTAGCVALDEQHLKTILQWLDKNQHPQIYFTT